jgi:triacylglycerol lipase
MPLVQRPILLTHGYARFDLLVQIARDRLPSPRAFSWFNRIVGDGLGYFRYIVRTLAAHGFEAHEASVGFAGPLARRAEDLRATVERILAPRGPGAKVNIIGHSMGGLDARYMIAKLGMADRVASLVTIGVPHLGTAVADHRLQEQEWPRRLIARLGPIGLDLSGVFDLTTARCRAFGADVEAAEAANPVTYIAYASAQRLEARVFPPLRGGWRILHEREGLNDGLVSLASQLWREELRGPGGTKRVEQREFPLPADHLNQIGWWHPWVTPLAGRRNFEGMIRSVYVRIAEDLRGRGLYG